MCCPACFGLIPLVVVVAAKIIKKRKAKKAQISRGRI
jgi:hypothetical protein